MPVVRRQLPSAAEAIVGALLGCAVVLAGPATGCGSGSAVTSDGEAAGRSGKSGGASGKGGGAGGGASGAKATGGKPGDGGSDGSTGGAAGEEGEGGEGGERGETGGSGGRRIENLLCGDGVCEHEAAEECDTCVADCGACPVCGDGVCGQMSGDLESCESCPEDCGACSECGDAKCSPESGETCVSCTQDCGPCETCGNGVCDDAETCESCVGDCGACPACGDGTCAGDETCGSCEDDCGECTECGDGKCEAGETATSCADDCAPDTDRKGCVVGQFTPQWGIVHAHTHFSPDAQGPKSGFPGEAFAHAKKANPPLDFLWISDHHNHLSPTQYASCRASAKKANAPGTFAAGCGWENGIYEGKQHASKWTGHFNVLFADKYYKMAINIPEIYQEVAKCEPCLAQFNHPPDPADMHGYQHYPIAQSKVRLVEFNGGASFKTHLGQYRKILNNGWKVSPSWNEDNHSGGWGDSPRATQVWAAKLTRGGIRTAVAANRTVATNDDTASLKLVADDKCWMGSVLEGLGDTKLTVTLKDKQEKDGFGAVILYNPKGEKVEVKACGGKNPCTLNFSVKVSEPTYYFVVAYQQDDDVLVSGPIWYEKKP